MKSSCLAILTVVFAMLSAAQAQFNPTSIIGDLFGTFSQIMGNDEMSDEEAFDDDDTQSDDEFGDNDAQDDDAHDDDASNDDSSQQRNQKKFQQRDTRRVGR